MAVGFSEHGWHFGQEFNYQIAGTGIRTLDLRIPYLLFALALLGGIVFTVWLVSATRFFLSTFILPGKSVSPRNCLLIPLSMLTTLPIQLRTFGHPSKTWAVITGASDGLGREYTLQLAKAGYSTLIISRTASKLDAVAQEIKQKFNTPVRTFTMDFAANDPSSYASLKQVVDTLEIAILINNVGLSHDIPTPFIETPIRELTDIININCLATLRVTQLVAVGMVHRKRGLILTMGSFGGLLPTPLLATYSGSKAFLQQWSTALGAELAEHNITVQLVQSYLVATAMSKIRRSSVMVPSPRAFVKSVLGKIGRSGGAQGFVYSSTPYWSHAVLQWAGIRTVGVNSWALLKWNLGFHWGIRRRALRKREGRARKVD